MVIAGKNTQIANVLTTEPVKSSLFVGAKSAPAKLMIGKLAISSDVLRDNELNRAQVTQNVINEIKQFQQEQRQIEEQYLKNGSVCNTDQLGKLLNRLGTLESVEFKTLLRENFYDSDVMKSAMCVAESISYMPSNEPGNVASNIRMKRWLHNLHRIGAESVEGFAMRSDFDKADDTFIVKAPRDINNPVLLHEYFVGVNGLNQLRKFVPNFAYIMGGFKCSLPVIDDEKKVVSWCNNMDYPIDYVIYENITPGKTLSETINAGCNFTEWLNYYMQILYALKIAHEKTDYTHYDLHTENVIIREVPQGSNGKVFGIPYETEKNITEYIVAGKIATIIDYGLSHIKYDGRHFGIADRSSWGVQSDKSFPMHDAYKLLMMSIRDMYIADQKESLNMASNILNFFNNTESVNDVVKNQIKTYYYLPYNDKTSAITFDELTTYIRKTFDMSQIIVSKTNIPILGCEGNDLCTTSSEFLRKSGLEMEPRARTVFDYYDLANRLSTEESSAVEKSVKEKVSAMRTSVKENFDWKNAKTDSVDEYSYTVSKIITLLDGGKLDKKELSGLVINTIYNPNDTTPLNNLFNDLTLSSYKKYIYRVAEIYDTFQEATVQHDSIVYTANDFNDKEVAKKLTGSYKQLKSRVDMILEEIIKYIKQDINYLRALLSDKTYEQAINQNIILDGKFAWWWRSFPEILQVIDKPIESYINNTG